MKRPLLLLWLALTSAACSDEPAPRDSSNSAGHAPVKRDTAVVGSTVFDPLRVAKIELEVGETDRETLRAEANRPLNSDDFSYVVASLRFDGQLYEMVGLRVKGNSSRRPSLNNPDAIPYKVDLNKFVSGQKLDGLTKLNLHRNASLNEYLSYNAFRKAGIAASRTGWADVTLNGVSLGLYTLVEQVDERMLAAFYDDPEAALYKPEPPAGYLTYVGDDIAAYGDVGYKADKQTDHATFLQLVRTINQEPLASWDKVLDVDSVLRYFAGNVALGNWDTYVAMGHNYYLFEATPGRLTMLPWDLNLSQSATSAVCPNELRPGPPGGGAPFPGGDGPVPPPGFMPPPGVAMGGMPLPPPGGGPVGGNREAPLYTRLMQSPDGFPRYAAALKAFLQGAGSVEDLYSDIDVVVPVLGERLTTDAVARLRSDIATRVTKLEAALETTTACATEAQ